MILEKLAIWIKNNINPLNNTVSKIEDVQIT